MAQKNLAHVEQLVSGLAKTIEAMVAAEVERRLADTTRDDRIPHPRWGLPSPVACSKAATGEIKAVKVGRRWLATRAELDRYFAAQEAEKITEETDETVATLDALLAKKSVKK